MSGKIEISREQVQRALDAIEQVGRRYEFIDFAFVRAVKAEISKILAAPVVERQEPTAYWYQHAPDREPGLCFGPTGTIPGGVVKPLYTSPPIPVADDLVRLLTRARIYARGEFRDEIDACLAGKTAPVSVAAEQTPYQPKGEWSFERCEDGAIVIKNGKDWTVIKSGEGPIYEQFLYRFCEQQIKELTAPTINENAEFEKWRSTQIDVLVRNGYPEGAEAFRNLGSVQWAGWQARACLDKVKEMNQ
jgi:hypothetical protein